MPWPPTNQTDLAIPIDQQISADVPGGLSPDVVAGTEETSTVDPLTGQYGMGALQAYDNPLDRIEELEQLYAKQRKALAPASGKRQAVIDFALEKLGMRYVWGGDSDAEGGYDCSGLLFYAFAKAGIDMPRVSMDQATKGKRVSLTDLKPGDLVAWENNPRQSGADHIALYLGNGEILEAPNSKNRIRRRKLRANEGAWGVKLDY